MATFTLAPNVKRQYLDNSGNPLDSGKLYVYEAGTSTPATVYQTSSGTAHAFPIVLDSAGRISGSSEIYLTQGLSYKFTLKTSADVEVWTQDNIAAVPVLPPGVDFEITAGENLLEGQQIYLSNGQGSKTAGRWYLTDASLDYASLFPLTAVAVTTTTTGNTGTARLTGAATVNQVLQVGKDYYLSNTPGAIATTPGTFTRYAGRSRTASILTLTSNPRSPFQGVYATDFGAIFDGSGVGSTDNTTPLRNAYAAAKAQRVPLYLPEGTGRITGKLTWNGPVPVYGVASANGSLSAENGTRLIKDGNFVGIEILTGAENCEYANFMLGSLGGADVSDGIQINLGGGGACTFHDIYVLQQGGNGITFLGGALNVFSNVSCVSCGSTGLLLSPTGTDFVTGNTFVMMDLRDNGANGLYLTDGGNGTFGNTFVGLVCQDNTTNGVRSDANVANYFEGYFESNGTDILFHTTSALQHAHLINAGFNPGVVDNGSNNTAFDQANNRWWVGTWTAPTPGTNAVGRTFAIAGGAAGAGGTGRAGGNCTVDGGAAVGTAGAAAGGDVLINGGPGINAGAKGKIVLQSDATQGIAVCGTTTPATSVSMDFQSVTKVPLLPRLTTAERDLLTAVDGMIIYNTTTAAIEGREAGAWVNL